MAPQSLGTPPPTPDQIQRYHQTVNALEQNIKVAAQMRDQVIKAHGLPPSVSSITPAGTGGGGPAINITLPSSDNSFGTGGGAGIVPSLIPPPSPGAPTADVVTRTQAPPGFGGNGAPSHRVAPAAVHLHAAPTTQPQQRAPRGGGGSSRRTGFAAPPSMKPGTTVRSRSGKTAFTILGSG